MEWGARRREGDLKKQGIMAGWTCSLAGLGHQVRMFWHTAALCWAHGLTAAGKKGISREERQRKQGSGKANFIMALRSGLFPPGPAEARKLG